MVPNDIHVLAPALTQELREPLYAISAGGGRGNDLGLRIDSANSLRGHTDECDHMVHVARPKLLEIRLIPDLVHMDPALVARSDRRNKITPIFDVLRLCGETRL